MALFALPFPPIDPVLIEIGPLAIRWYALAYIVGILGGWYVVRTLDAHRSTSWLSTDKLDSLVVWMVAGIILGGRLGYVLFLQPTLLSRTPSRCTASVARWYVVSRRRIGGYHRSLSVHP